MQFDVKVIPSAKRNVMNFNSIPVKVYLTAPAVDGKANKALVDFLSEHYKITKRNISIIKGLKSRYKTIIIESLKVLQ
ncbi:MAG: DUF167 domain-containing protein [Candidatus Omnitrophica bacterium]|nr:DUF167 domain-containing protein [Candidatus Omnitrophota bacterium]